MTKARRLLGEMGCAPYRALVKWGLTAWLGSVQVERRL